MLRGRSIKRKFWGCLLMEEKEGLDGGTGLGVGGNDFKLDLFK